MLLVIDIGNTNITILLKTQSPKIMREINEHYPKIVRLVINDKGENRESKNASNQSIEAVKITKDAIHNREKVEIIKKSEKTA